MSAFGVQRGARRWLVAVAAVVLATVLRVSLDHLPGDRFPVFLFALAVTAAAAHGGRGPGLLATLLSLFAVHTLIVQARPDAATATGIALFGLTGAGISMIGGRLRDALLKEQRLRLEAQTAEEQYRHDLAAQLAALRAGRIATWEWDRKTGAFEHNGDVDALLAGPVRSVEQFLERVHPDDRERAAEFLYGGQAERGERLEFRLAAAGMDGRWMSTRAAIADRNPSRLAGITMDITAERTAQEELRRVSSRLELHLANVPVAVVEYAPDFTIRRWSNEAERLFGWSAGEVVGLRASDLRWMHEDDMPALAAIMQDMLSGTGTRYFSPNRNWTKDGRVLDLEWYNSALRDAEGRPTSILCFGVDATARNQAERRLRESRRQLRELADSLPQLVWVIEADGEVSYVNSRWVAYFGVAKGDASFERWLDFVHPEDRQRVKQEWRHSLATGEDLETEYRLRGSDGEYRWFLGRAVAIREADGTVGRWFRTSTNLQTQKLALEALGKTNEDLRQFAYAVSHDLQEPMRTVNAYTQLLARTLEASLDSRQQLFMTYVTTGARRVMELLTDLRQYLEVSEETNESFEPVDVEDALASAVANLEAAMAESRAVVRGESLGMVCARQVHVVQLLQNLISNAIKYRSEAPPEVVVSCTREDGFEHITVRDNGIGIPEQYHTRIFGVFKRLHGGRYPGTGMGLAICQRITARYGGRIWVESEPAKGSTFHFTLPAAS